MKCPLTGLDCTNPKNISVASENGEIKVCESCSKMQPNIIDEIFKNLIELGLDLLDQSDAEKEKEDEDEKICCPFCSATIEDINKNGRLGCIHCYEHFGPDIMGSIKKYHGSLKHVGKVPKQWLRSNFNIEDHIKQLEETIKTNIKNEQYEEAAAGRDRLKAIFKSQEQYVKLTKKISETDDDDLVSEIQKQLTDIKNQCFNDSQSNS